MPPTKATPDEPAKTPATEPDAPVVPDPDKTIETQDGEQTPADVAVPGPTYQPDRVAMISLRADGTPDQTPGFEHLLPHEPDPRLAVPAEAPAVEDAGPKNVAAVEAQTPQK